MRTKNYPGSSLKIEQTLADGSNYHQYIASYLSDGLKIYGLLTVPLGDKPEQGWPVIIFNHGYIPPEVYKTTERYVAYVDYFAKNGYIVFKPDYRGNGSSEGSPEGAYYSPAYTSDVLNALVSLKKYPDANPEKIGMWGHSMGGNITLRSLIVDPKDTSKSSCCAIKAAVIWGGVVGTYDDLMNNWTRRVPFVPSQRQLALRNRSRADLIQKYGSIKDNPDFWHSIDPNYFLADISAPVQLEVGLADEEVPWQWSQNLATKLKSLNKTVEFFSYPEENHNISGPSFNIAIQHSLDFFDKYLK
ncbi:alpha/beta fold hydrolase [Candidatus Daviesbacteria bacterium]|nr:alpha/beta fold hydrolase [Candidatus Daviesbacteria bacterium]